MSDFIIITTTFDNKEETTHRRIYTSDEIKKKFV